MNKSKSIFISDLLKRENNNLDIFRIVAACLVIVGHSYVLFPSVGEEDLIRQFTGFTYSGGLAVKIFFFISGLVVTNSILNSNSFTHFTISRIFRIFPALIFLCLVTVFLIGPMVSNLNSSDYFNSEVPYRYLKNIFLSIEYHLPGVFTTNNYPNAVNGSLWTLPYEVGCYLFLLGIFCIGVLKSRLVAGIIFGIVIIESVLPQRLFTYWVNENPEILSLPACFSIGALLALNKDRIKTGYLQTIGFSMLTYVLWHTRFVEMLFCLSVFSLILNLSFHPFILKLKMKSDISYGIYLWGFIVQQVLQNYVPGETVYLKMFISAVLSAAIAFVSWMVIEKNAIRLGKSLINKLNIT